MNQPEFGNRVSSLLTRNGLGDDVKTAAKWIGVPVNTLKKWLDKSREPSASAVRVLELLEYIEAFVPSSHHYLLGEAVS